MAIFPYVYGLLLSTKVKNFENRSTSGQVMSCFFLVFTNGVICHPSISTCTRCAVYMPDCGAIEIYIGCFLCVNNLFITIQPNSDNLWLWYLKRLTNCKSSELRFSFDILPQESSALFRCRINFIESTSLHSAYQLIC